MTRDQDFYCPECNSPLESHLDIDDEGHEREYPDEYKRCGEIERLTELLIGTPLSEPEEIACLMEELAEVRGV